MMSATTIDAPRARSIADALAKAGVDHVVGLPDNASAALYEELAARPELAVLTVTREGEAFAIASGLWLGGKTPVVLIQNTGFLESGDSLRGTAMRMGVPLVCLVTYRGYQKLPVGADAEAAPDVMTRADVDSAAVVLEPTLEAWRIPFTMISTEADVSALDDAFENARKLSQPVVVLIARGVVSG